MGACESSMRSEFREAGNVLTVPSRRKVEIPSSI